MPPLLLPRRSRHASRCVAPLVAMWLLACAVTQSPNAMAQMEPLNGIKAGEARVHPFFELDLRYDSAAAALPLLTPELMLHFRPGLKMELPTSLLDATLEARLDYVWYTGLINAGSRSLSRLQAESTLDASFNKDGAVEVQLSDFFSRSDRTQNPAFGIGVLSLYNELKIATPVHPGGQALEVKPEFVWATEFFEPYFRNCDGDVSCNPDFVFGSNYNDLRLGAEGRYKFLPKTALLGDISFNMRRHADRVANPDVYLLHLGVGLAGLITPRISVLAKLGWGQGLGTVASGTVTAQAEITYLLNEVSSVKGGYLRLIKPVSGYGLFGDDRVYLEARLLLAGRLTLQSAFAFDYLTFYRASNRNDRLYTLSAGPEYQVTRWFVTSFSYSLALRGSDNVTTTNLNFARHEGTLRMTFSY